MFNIFKRKPKRTLYFIYGANMSRRSMLLCCPSAVPVKPIYLTGYRLLFSHHATIEQDVESSVPGVLWSLTEDCVRKLDTQEEYPTYYKKIFLRQFRDSFTAYQMNAPIDVNHKPTAKYTKLLEEGYADWNLDLQFLDDALYYGIK